ncbi:MAG: DNA polymerase III subunit beta [Bacteroidetes bacterium]|nr:MAG: DNA polymerase III subunit beta [Bacteroidota bacterium]
MKFIISSTTLLRSLQKISGVLSTNSTLPILEDFLFVLEGDTLTVTASDLETTISVMVTPEKADDAGSVAIPARQLLDIMKTFPEIPVTIISDPETLNVEILAGEGKYKMIGQSPEEFPQVPELEDTKKVTVNGVMMVNAFNNTLFATGNDELRPVMSGVYCEINEDNLTFVATDAHKLVRYRRNEIKSETADSIIFPKKTLSLARHIISENDEEVVMEFNETNATFKFDDILIVCRLIEGKYPNYEAVIPSENPFKLTIGRQSLLNALRRVSIFGSKSTHQVRFKITGKELVLSAEDIDYSSEGKERLTCSYEGKDIEIGFNFKFMQEMLSTLTCENITLEMSAPNRAGIIKPESNEDENEDILMLIMPVMLTS